VPLPPKPAMVTLMGGGGGGADDVGDSVGDGYTAKEDPLSRYKGTSHRCVGV
jgi:hypothetical protein